MVKKGVLNPIKINTNHYEYNAEKVYSFAWERVGKIKI